MSAPRKSLPDKDISLHSVLWQVPGTHCGALDQEVLPTELLGDLPLLPANRHPRLMATSFPRKIFHQGKGSHSVAAWKAPSTSYLAPLGENKSCSLQFQRAPFSLCLWGSTHSNCQSSLEARKAHPDWIRKPEVQTPGPGETPCWLQAPLPEL